MVMTFHRANRLVVEWGVEIAVPAEECDISPEVVFVDKATLARIADQGQWDTQFGATPVLLDRKTGDALVHAGLAVKETKGGYHGTDALRTTLEGWGWL